MERFILLLAVIVFVPLCDGLWRNSEEERRLPRSDHRRGIHYHSKRHMLPVEKENRVPKQSSYTRGRDNRKKISVKPSGHLAPLKEDDIDNDDVMSVAVGPPPVRPSYDRSTWKTRTKNTSKMPNPFTSTTEPPSEFPANEGVTIVKDLLSQLAREFIMHQVSEDFAFGQYVGIAMKNITKDLKIKFQHDILEIIIKYQTLSQGEAIPTIALNKEAPANLLPLKNYKQKINETEEPWPDFSNLAKMVGTKK